MNGSKESYWSISIPQTVEHRPRKQRLERLRGKEGAEGEDKGKKMEG